MRIFIRFCLGFMLNIIKVLSILLMVGAAGCTSFKPYKMEIRQGNYITPEMRAKVRVGMSHLQVTAALGSPLISDVFHSDRWDYIYRFVEKDKLVEQQRLTIFFEGDFVKRIDDSQLNTAVTSIPVDSGK
jgi:outer membrane protein assembly factor BamE